KKIHLVGVLSFGAFCFLFGIKEEMLMYMLNCVGPQDIPYVYCFFYFTFVPMRWIYYWFKKWNYYLLDFCYYANTIFLVMLIFYPKNEKLFMVCFSFAEEPLAWALTVWCYSLVFSSLDKIFSVLIHLLPALFEFCLTLYTFDTSELCLYLPLVDVIGMDFLLHFRWWDLATFEAMHTEGSTSQRASWTYVEDKSYLWTWLFVVPLVAYTLWQILYIIIVNVLLRQRLLRDPEVMTSYKYSLASFLFSTHGYGPFRELSKKEQKTNNMWWRLSGVLGDHNRMLMYILFQVAFTVSTMALTVPIFLSYEFHVIFQILKVSASIWNGGSFLLEVMPRQVIMKEKKKLEMLPLPVQPDQPATVSTEIPTETNDFTESDNQSEQPCIK
ncbi:hypothetical protein MKX03_012861, partial [Papaver bracteatum]